MNSVKKEKILIGPFKQILTLEGLPRKGAIKDNSLACLSDAAILIEDGLIAETGPFERLAKKAKKEQIPIQELISTTVAVPGFIDAHTHLCFAGSRAKDYSARNNGATYQEIAKAGGGIWDTVLQTRQATQPILEELLIKRLDRVLSQGVTTIEVKSGYGLSVGEELKMLHAINRAGRQHRIEVIPTCLAAHIIPKEFGSERKYLNSILSELAPIIKEAGLSNRFDIFIEEGAFSQKEAKKYLDKLKAMGFDLTAHADQFSPGGSAVGVAAGALSVDHLEASGKKEIELIAKSETVAMALPGASMGIGCDFTPARKLLDAGASLAIASDWNPGSAPHGYLLTQAALLGTFQKLSAAEVFAGITFRAGQALGLNDRGQIVPEQVADICGFLTDDYREILYHQGQLKVNSVWKKGMRSY